jgi:[pyruvate, water dikinase]-phosphate phosphotransferase / [pyruvate, water dikinase] kinase
MEKVTVRSVFFISDGTGITAETLGHSLLAQFPDCHFRQVRLPFIDSIEKVRKCAGQIRLARLTDGQRPIVLSTLVSPEALAILREEDAFFLSMFEHFIGQLEDELGVHSTHVVGRFHGIAESENYQSRIEAINFTLAHDDGQSNAKLEQAEVILVGVSRSGKTPTSLYLAMQFGVRAANYPLIPEDFERNQLPGDILRFRQKLYGLTISPERLSEVRGERRPNSVYASLDNCRFEIDAALRLMRTHGIAFADSTSRSIEEISAIILQEIGNLHNLR